MDTSLVLATFPQTKPATFSFTVPRKQTVPPNSTLAGAFTVTVVVTPFVAMIVAVVKLWQRDLVPVAHMGWMMGDAGGIPERDVKHFMYDRFTRSP